MRIRDLDQITNETIDLSQHLAIDDPSQTFKLTLLQLRDFFVGQLYPPGSTMFRFDSRTPGECGFPGTWSKIAADMSLHTARADSSNLGMVDGDNFPAVPLQNHGHTATMWTDAVVDHDHAASGAQDPHAHSATQDQHSHSAAWSARNTEACSDGCGEGTLSNTNVGFDVSVGIGIEQPAVHIEYAQPAVYVNVLPAGAHSHTGGVTIANSGVDNPLIDVRGARIHGHLWHRTA